MNQRSFCAILCALAITSVLFSIACGGGGSNAAPVPPPSELAILSTPPTQASEGNVYSYAIQASVPGTAYRLTTAPTGAALSGSSITWTPTSQLARKTNQFTVTATYAGLSATQSWTVTPAGIIRGATATTCISDSGQTTTVAGYLGGATVQALVPTSNGGFDTFNGTVAQDGTFTIPNVPPGSFWLIVPGTTLWTSSSSVDLGYRHWGGCHPESPSNAGTSLQASIDGLNPWQYYDYFYFAVPNAMTSHGAITPVGATSISFEIPYNNLVLLNAANGDNAYFAQLVTATYGGVDFHALQKFAGPLPVTVQNGAVNSLSVTLTPLPQSDIFRANIRGSAFTALHDSMSPGSTSPNPGYNLRLDITPDSSGPSSMGLFLLFASHPFATDTDAGDVPYANPYPPAWTRFLDYTDMATQSLLPPGATTPVQPVLTTRVVSTDLPTVSNPIAPLVGPALNPQINGASLFTDKTIVGTTPTLTWQPPAVGTASGYIIRVYQIAVNNGSANLEAKTFFFTSSTSVVLPPAILISGNSYYFQIESVYRKNIDLSVTPRRESFPEGTSDLGSGIISVQ